MSVSPSDKVNAFVLKEVYREELKEWFCKLEGTKVLVCNDDFVSTFELVVDNEFLKVECGVVFKTTLTQSSKRLPKSRHVVFVCKPSLPIMDLIHHFIDKQESGSEFSNKSFHLLFVPKRSLLCEKRLKELGLSTTLSSIDHLEMDILPLSSDLLSMEWHQAYKDCYLDQDDSCLLHICKSITMIQSLFGPIPNLYSKGNLASRVIDMLQRMHKEMASNQPSLACKIDNLVVIDRQVDPLTPLLTPLTYEGLIDELFGINQGTVKLPADRFIIEELPSTTTTTTVDATINPFEPPPLKKVNLSPLDDLYAEIRDKNFNAVGNCINQRVRNLSTQYDERHAAKTVSEIKKFVAKIAHIRATKANLATHTTIAEMIKEVTDDDEFRSFLAEQQECLDGDTERIKPYIEESIALKRPLIKVLRLICLQCYANNGLKPKVMEFYKREIIQTYGFQYLVSLHNIEKCGLLYTQAPLKTFPLLKRQLKLNVKDVNELNPDDVSYVYSGYAPISVRLAQILNRAGWRSIADVVNTMLPGSVKEENQAIPEWLSKKATSEKSSKLTLVFYIGGVTYAEVSALRFLSQQEDSASEYLIASTHMLNSSTYLQSIMHYLTPKPPNPFL